MIAEDGTDGSSPSLFDWEKPELPSKLRYYMDDIFGGYRDFDEGFAHLRDDVFPRIAWGMLKLSFKKIKLFSSMIDALGVTHEI